MKQQQQQPNFSNGTFLLLCYAPKKKKRLMEKISQKQEILFKVVEKL